MTSNTLSASDRLLQIENEAVKLFHGNRHGAYAWMESTVIQPLGRTVKACADSDRDTRKALGEIARLLAGQTGAI